jgi:hypothetical protein
VEAGTTSGRPLAPALRSSWRGRAPDDFGEQLRRFFASCCPLRAAPQRHAMGQRRGSQRRDIARRDEIPAFPQRVGLGR